MIRLKAKVKFEDGEICIVQAVYELYEMIVTMEDCDGKEDFDCKVVVIGRNLDQCDLIQSFDNFFISN